MSFLDELKRRNVVRAAAAYAALAWLLIQIAETTFPAFGLGDAAVRVVIVAASIGFLPALVLAWAFELTPDGLKRDRDVDRASPESRRMTRRLDRFVMVTLALALGYFALDKFVISPRQQASELAAAMEEARQAGRAEAIVESYGDRSIAVLPFADLSPAGDEGYFSDGIAEELLNVLARVNDLRVISRSSSFALRDTQLTVPEIARKLGVSYILEGSVRKAGGKIRVTAQLIDGRSDTQLWSDTYDSELDDVFHIEDQISAKVAAELKVRLLGPPSSTNATNLAAHDLYLQGRSLVTRSGQTDPQRAVELFEQVIQAVPDYAPAYASLALALIFLNDNTRSLQASRIEAAATRALAIDPANSDALVALGRLRWLQWLETGTGESRVAEAREALDGAIKSNPNNPLAYRWLGSTYLQQDPVRYYKLVQQAYLIDPLYSGIGFQVSFALLRLGRLDEALAEARNGTAERPTDLWPYLVAESVHRISGRLDRALMTAYRIYRADPGAVGNASIVWTLIDLRELDLADTWLHETRQRSGRADLDQEAVLTFLSGRQQRAVQIYVEAHARGDIPDQRLAYHLLRMTRDFPRARVAYERAFKKSSWDMEHFDPLVWWPFYIDYALALQRTGDTTRARSICRAIRAQLKAQMALGVVADSATEHLAIQLAEVDAIDGDWSDALTALRSAVRDGYTCAGCLRDFPHFDALRGEPAFATVVAELDARIDAQRKRLTDDGLLLTPSAVAELQGYSFDPFAL